MKLQKISRGMFSRFTKGLAPENREKADMKLHKTDRARFRGVGVLASALVAATLLAACQPIADAPDAGQKDTPQIEEETPQISFGVLRAPAGALAVVADDHDWYEEAGVDVEFKSFAEGGGPAIIQAMAGGTPDIALLNLATTIIALGQGTFDVQIVSVAANPARALPLIATEDIQSVEDLRGKRVSTPGSGGLYYVLIATLQKHGMTLEDIDFKPLPVGEAQAAFLTGSVDAVVSSANGAQLILAAQPTAHVLFDGTDFAPGDNFGMPDVIIATRNAVKNKPEAISRFLKAYHGQAVPYLADNTTRDGVIAEVQEYMESVGAGVELELTTSVVDSIEWYNLDEARDILRSKEFLDLLNAQAQFWLDAGVIEEMPDLEGALNTALIG